MNKKSSVTRGFTLIELLVVIAIIAVLAAMLMPTISSSMARSRRISCMSNIKNLITATLLSASEHDGRLPELNTAIAYPYWYNQKVVIPWLENYGMGRETVYCPSNREWNKDSYWKRGASVSILGYNYLAMSDNWPGSWSFPGATQGKDKLFPANTFDNDTEFKVLWVDLNRKWAGQWGSGSNHSESDGPTGANVGYLDGHVTWVRFSNMALRAKTSSTQLYW